MREALEAIHAQVAIEEYARERAQEAASSSPDERAKAAKFMGGDSAAILEDGSPEQADARARTGEEGSRIADAPHFVEGWDEWNETELAETDPVRQVEIRT